MAVQLSPVFNLPNIQDLDGLPASGYKIFTYEAGSNSILKATFTDDTGTVENSNPIVLDSSGNLPESIWLIENEAYNLVLTKADGTTVIKEFDGVFGVQNPPAGGSESSVIWITVPGATYLGPTQFLVPGNYATEFKAGNRVRLTLNTGFTYGVVSAVAFSSPNTSVTIVNDGAVIDPSLSQSDYSILIASQGETVDAGGVSYFDAMPYSTTNTVGWKIKQLVTSDSTISTRINSLQQVWTSTGGPTNFAIAPSPVITSYSYGQIFNVKFNATSSGTPTINVNGLGAKNLYQYTSSGAKTAAVIISGMTSQINYDGTDFILLDQLPAAAASAPPRGEVVFSSNGTFTVPAGVYSIKVTVVGGGGGGGQGVTDGNIESGYYSSYGGSGGFGGNGVRYLNVNPGDAYSVSIGAGGAGTNSTGGAGGTTTFGPSYVVATGGGGGSAYANGANGFGSISEWGFASQAFMIGSATKGSGGQSGFGAGVTGQAGTPGMCIVEW